MATTEPDGPHTTISASYHVRRLSRAISHCWRRLSPTRLSATIGAECSLERSGAARRYGVDAQ